MSSSAHARPNAQHRLELQHEHFLGQFDCDPGADEPGSEDCDGVRNYFLERQLYEESDSQDSD